MIKHLFAACMCGYTDKLKGEGEIKKGKFTFVFGLKSRMKWGSETSAKINLWAKIHRCMLLTRVKLLKIRIRYSLKWLVHRALKHPISKHAFLRYMSITFCYFLEFRSFFSYECYSHTYTCTHIHTHTREYFNTFTSIFKGR